MKKLRLILFALFILVGIQSSKAQSDNLETITKDRIVNLNNKVQLNLTAEQQHKMLAIFLTRETQMESLQDEKISLRKKGIKTAEIDIEFINSLQKLLSESQMQRLISSNSIITIE